MRNSIFTKKSIWVWGFLMILAVVGISYFIQPSSDNLTHSTEASGNTPASADSQISEKKNFRQTLSDMAWGRDRKKGPAIKPEARIAPADDSPEAQQKAMMTLQSRMAYCAQNWEKDPSCGAQPQPNKRTQ